MDHMVAIARNAGRDQLEPLVAFGWISRPSSLECAPKGIAVDP
jgi:hypothetical protein